MNKRWYARIYLAVLLAAWTTSAVAQHVTTDFDHNVTFSGYKTYSWSKIQTANSLWDDRVQQDVDAALAARGLRRVESGGDLILTAFGKTRDQQTLETFYSGFGGWRWRGMGGTATTQTYDYKVGTLVLDLFDAGTKRLVWRGVSTDTLSDKPEKNQKKLQQSVDKMFKHFPPEKKNG
jgi:hypothetical protein